MNKNIEDIPTMALKFYQKVYTDRVIDLILFVKNAN